jgi:NitT/TauT family transport system permease protein
MAREKNSNRGGGWRRVKVEHVVLPLAAIGLWQVISGRLIPTLFISSPSAVAIELYRLFSSGTVLPDVVVTYSQVGAGLLVGFGGGVVLGNLMGISTRAGRLLSPYLTFFFTIPLISIAPIFVIWFGIGFAMKAALVAFLVFFLTARTTVVGMMTLDQLVINSINIMGASRWQLIRLTILPQEILWITTAAKLAIPLSIAAEIVGEFISSNSGLGYLMNNAASVLDTTELLSVVVIISFTVTIVVGGVSLLERKLLSWR